MNIHSMVSISNISSKPFHPHHCNLNSCAWAVQPTRCIMEIIDKSATRAQQCIGAGRDKQHKISIVNLLRGSNVLN
jgi:Fe-S-cluster-containing hydrogenase component 2